RLSIEQLQRYVEPQPDLENFLRIVQVAVDSDQEELRISSSATASLFGLDELALTKLGCLVASAPDVCRDGSFAADYSSWSFLPSYNVHFFRRVHTIDDFLVVQGSLVPRAAADGTTTTSPGTGFKLDEGATLPDGIVTFLVADVVESVREASAPCRRKPDPGLGDDLLDRGRYPPFGHSAGVGRQAPARGA